MSRDTSTKAGPPRLARLLAILTAHPDDRDLLLADLAERFERVAEVRGVPAARRWYWSQVVRGLPYRIVDGRDRTGGRGSSGTWGDVRLGVRVLRRRPLYAVGVVGTLAIGLASAAVVGSLAWSIWFAPMPFPDPDRVVRLFELEPPDEAADPSAEPTRWRLSPPLLEQLREHDWTTVRAVAGVGRNVADWERDGDVSRIDALTVSPELFGILGMAPLRGRVLSNDPDAAEVVLTEELWARAFGRDPSVVGRTMTLSGRPHEIVGVVRPPAGYPGDADVFTRMAWAPEELVADMRGARYLDVIARVDPAFDVDDASAELARIVSAAGREHPIHAGWGGEAVALPADLLEPYRGVLALLFIAGATFLLLAVVNVTGLVAARTVEGRPERGIRLALGASEGRLLRGGVVESAVLGATAAVVALVLAKWLLGPVRALVPAEIPRADTVALTAGMMGTVGALALLAGCTAGGLGHLLSRGAGPVDARRRAGSSERLGARNLIVMSQVALTTLLVTAGASVLRTVTSLRGVDLGFEPDGVASAQISLTPERYPSPETRLVLWRDILDALDGRGLTAAVGTGAPMAGVDMRWVYRTDPTAERTVAQYHVVSPRYFSVMGIGLLDGRPFDGTDREGSPPVVVVNRALAEAEFPDGSAIGREIEVVSARKTIVGVVEGTRHFGPGEEVPREIYAPFTQDPWPHAQVLVQGTAGAVGAVVSSALEEIDPFLGLPPVEPYGRFVSEWFAGLRLQLVIVGVLAAVGLTLATLGLYALIAYRVSTRRREIGVRMALGASGHAVFSQLVRQGLGVASAGMVAGLAAWYVAAPVAREWLGDAGLGDPWIPVAVALVVAATSTIATAIPARRSVMVDPVVTLKAD